MQEQPLRQKLPMLNYWTKIQVKKNNDIEVECMGCRHIGTKPYSLNITWLGMNTIFFILFFFFFGGGRFMKK